MVKGTYSWQEGELKGDAAFGGLTPPNKPLQRTALSAAADRQPVGQTFVTGMFVQNENH
jgi:hypothetical protein